MLNPLLSSKTLSACSKFTDLASLAVDIRTFLGSKDEPTSRDLQAFWLKTSQDHPHIDRHNRRLTKNERTEEAVFIHMLCCWVDQGLPIFELTHSLTSALLLTDPSNLKGEHVKLPFDTFMVKMPQPFWSTNDEIVGKSDAAITFLQVHVYLNRNGEQLMTMRQLAETGVSVWENCVLIPEGPLGPWLNAELIHRDSGRYSARTTVQDNNRQRAVRRLLVNLCLYLTERGHGEPKKRNPTHKSEGGLPFTLPNVWLVGREVKLDKNLIQAAKDWTEATQGKRSGWRVRSRFTVRGHWRNQVHGPGRVDRKLIWIEPFWKGTGPGLSHLYT